MRTLAPNAPSTILSGILHLLYLYSGQNRKTSANLTGGKTLLFRISLNNKGILRKTYDQKN